MTKSLLILLCAFALTCAGLVPTPAEAKRIGSGGMQRSLPARTPAPAAPTAPAQAAPTPPAGAAPAPAAPKRSWLGPIAGLAAGLGLAALMSHLGLGAEFGNIVMLALLALLAFVAIRFVMRRFAGAASPAPMATPEGLRFAGDAPTPGISSAPTHALLPPTSVVLPAGFDAAAFERVAKMIFVRMQAANDSADLNDVRNFTTPEMFASIKLDLQDRANAAQTTDVVTLAAEVLEAATEAERQIVSVRFHGLIREEKDAAAAPFDEVWHLVKPADGSREWAIAGIQQAA